MKTDLVIKILKEESSALEMFSKVEWPYADLEHYGAVMSWEDQTFFLVCEVEGEIQGYLKMFNIAGVANIKELLVAKKARRTGVGKKLMLKAETVAKQEGAHKIFLNTGKDWVANHFYLDLGYKKVADLPNHYHGFDFVEYVKFI